jgi:hypothetical protein
MRKRPADGPGSIGGHLRRLGYPVGANYADYLASEHWKKTRKRYFASRATAQQCACGNPGRALHHKTYVRLGAERLSDLELVCDDCHKALHAKEPKRVSKKATGAKSGYRRVAPDPRPRVEWSYDRDIRGKFVAPPQRATRS